MSSGHAGYVNDGDQRYYCNVCGRNYLRKANLVRHVRHECIGVPPHFNCNICSAKYRRKEDLVRHIRTKHNMMPTHNYVDMDYSSINYPHNIFL